MYPHTKLRTAGASEKRQVRGYIYNFCIEKSEQVWYTIIRSNIQPKVFLLRIVEYMADESYIFC